MDSRPTLSLVLQQIDHHRREQIGDEGVAPVVGMLHAALEEELTRVVGSEIGLIDVDQRDVLLRGEVADAAAIAGTTLVYEVVVQVGGSEQVLRVDGTTGEVTLAPGR